MHYIPNFKEPVLGFANHFAPHLMRTVTKQIVQLMLPMLQLQFLALAVVVKLVGLRSYFRDLVVGGTEFILPVSGFYCNHPPVLTRLMDKLIQMTSSIWFEKRKGACCTSRRLWMVSSARILLKNRQFLTRRTASIEGKSVTDVCQSCLP